MIYAVDFDGVLYDPTTGALDDRIVRRVDELRRAGHKVHLHTSRQGQALKDALDLLAGVNLDGVEAGKFYADYYVDDRNMTPAEFLEEKMEERMATPQKNIKFKDKAQARLMTLASPSMEENQFGSDHYVEGYAANYEAYLLYDDGEAGKVYERFAPGCFDKTDMEDVILQYDHAGRVFARTTNDTLVVKADDTGLFIAADLSKTDRARDLHADIAARMITKMSWRFMVGDYHIEHQEGTNDVTIVHTHVPKIYDVSAVSLPANNTTEINARSWADGVIGQAARSEAELDERRRRLRLKLLLGGTKKWKD